ncbi:MAG: biopolymer transporter ExbD [Candidatus Omnitrophica bacterium]|nr:biopolymer transporter ExbD [Candidatus Omnitrophota bacterium]
MKRPASRSFIHAPESIALTDMILNLFIFFFVSFSLLYTFSPERTARMEVDLPSAATGRPSADQALAVTVTEEGRLYLAEEQVSEQAMRSRLKELARQGPGAAVAIRADEAAPARALVAIFDACREAGITQTSFAVRAKGNSQ